VKFLNDIFQKAKRGEKPIMSICNIPARRCDDDDRVLEERCRPLFWDTNKFEVMILCDNGILMWGNRRIADVIEKYRSYRIVSVIAAPRNIVDSCAEHAPRITW
jgi:hypothetical protein